MEESELKTLPQVNREKEGNSGLETSPTGFWVLGTCQNPDLRDSRMHRMRGGSQIGYQNPQEFDNISIARGFKGDSLWDEIWELLLRCLLFSVLFYFFIEKQQN